METRHFSSRFDIEDKIRQYLRTVTYILVLRIFMFKEKVKTWSRQISVIYIFTFTALSNAYFVN